MFGVLTAVWENTLEEIIVIALYTGEIIFIPALTKMLSWYEQLKVYLKEGKS